ncbi:hypothetical protein AtNW77_Chr3g0177731 [Arabidopsis thaliana]|uniref:Uncharacterized protein n=4 Tax=Arabidopsis TaxID=3701 RepID=A0A384L246_ARATH|nr:uncharacterized protein AT3G19274 [Arabidopsis thaliana]KAG7625808.1 hypothetical protein ISN45_At03g020200 [Arabidopsis thaliana x Arabidopsis arenosa]KAG7631811.1 hypothetical protein ISN44_As03g020080 [Arabidopsis suecica]AEE76216.1 hypothetical protein AT3G19274 [Arabidopsis thaliana]OAP03979.1 hypothetical protein AXX17_AT3G20480 [Arabidopsis thaliana]CAA0382958.1 unnamed protein product [Arabidopsis thaliana]|eukprot:NP_001319590.1 hypothetical protein AT3G19274 [Arabidopsis thaliana]
MQYSSFSDYHKMAGTSLHPSFPVEQMGPKPYGGKLTRGNLAKERGTHARL